MQAVVGKQHDHDRRRIKGDMLDMTFRRKLAGLLDDSHAEHLALETQVLSSPAVGITRVRQTEALSELLQIQFEEMDRLIGDDASLYREALAFLVGHPIYRDAFLQSAVVAQRPSGVGGGPFGFRFRRMVFDQPDIGYSPYAQILNDALLDLPLCRAIRKLSDSSARLLNDLPAGARVLGLDCGPAPEFLSLTPQRRASLDVTLCEINPEASTHVSRHAGVDGPVMRQAEQLPVGKHWDLVLAPYALTALAAGHAGHDKAAALVRDLFGRLAPGGRLVMASPLTTGGENPYRHSHRMLLDSDEIHPAVHRSPAELIGLTALLPDGGFNARIVTEDLVSTISASTVLAVLVVESTQV
jgi:hypothetical protein